LLMEDPNKLISEGLVIAGMPLLGYSVAFAYEYGYASYYGIPWQLISLSLTQVLATAAILCWLFITLFFVSNLAFTILSNKKKPNPMLAYYFDVLWPVLLYFVALFLIFGTHWREWIFFLAFLALFSVLEFGLPLVTQKDKETYMEKLAAAQAAEPRTLFDVAARTGWARHFKVLINISLMLLLARDVGRAEALNKNDYWVDSLRTNMVVLRIYGDTVVSHEYDPKNMRLAGDFLVTKISPTQRLRFQEQSLGHLTK
jgi:hypothetical protein